MSQYQTAPDRFDKQRFYLGIGFIILFIALIVWLYIAFRADMKRTDWVAFYVLIGFVGGLLFYLVDPLREQQINWKGMANIGGSAAVGIVFMLLANKLTPTAIQELEDLFTPSYTSWIPINKASGKPANVKIRPLDTQIPIPSLPEDQPFKQHNLSLVKDQDVYLVVLEGDSSYFLGKLESGDFKKSNLRSSMHVKIDNLQIRKIFVNQKLEGIFPFMINLYLESETLRFNLKHTKQDSIIVDRAANKELTRILKIDGKLYLVVVVLSVPNGNPPFAEFAIGEIELSF